MRAFGLLSLLVACASAPPPPVASDAPVELSGEWNDVDAELVAAAIIEDFMRSDHLAAWRAEHPGATPTLSLGVIKNKTTGYVDHRFFTARFEAALVRSGKVSVLAAAPTRSDGEARAASPDTDFVLTGTLVAQEDEGDDRKVTAYLATVEIVETRSAKKAWIGQKRIRKVVER